ncbi:MAG: hypothetical protein V3U26_04950 [Dehalococcoidia bacterium]
MYNDRDRFGTFLQCLQCGHLIDLNTSAIHSTADLVAKLEKRTGTKVPVRDKDAVGSR